MVQYTREKTQFESIMCSKVKITNSDFTFLEASTTWTRLTAEKFRTLTNSL
jgi:hypothetical protein